MANVVNLEKIVSYVFESEIESQPDEVTRESKRKSCYEGTREQLNQIFKNLGFHTNLIKDENQGFADKGSYIIPREDGQFIEWLISILNTDDGKALKAGNFSKCDHEVTRKLIDGLISILQHLDVNEEVIELQKDLMEQKTMVYISFEAKKMWQKLYDSLYAVANLMEIAQSFIPYENQREFWVKWREEFCEFLGNKETEYMSLERYYKKRILEDAPRLTMKEASFSERSNEIIAYLEDNEEYMSLRQEYEALFSPSKKKTASQLKKDEKRKKEIIRRQYEIFDSIAKSLPIDVETLTPIEKYMCVCNHHFSLHYVQEEQQWALLVDDKYYRTERILQSKYPYEDDDIVSVLHLDGYFSSSKKKR